MKEMVQVTETPGQLHSSCHGLDYCHRKLQAKVTDQEPTWVDHLKVNELGQNSKLVECLEKQYDNDMGIDKDKEKLQMKVLAWGRFDGLVAVADYNQMEMKLYNQNKVGGTECQERVLECKEEKGLGMGILMVLGMELAKELEGLREVYPLDKKIKQHP